MRVLITGATGLLGSHIAEVLVAGGTEVVALCREGSDTSFVESLGCLIARGDVRADAETLRPAFRGCSALVHAAAQVYAGGSWPAVRESNVDGTRNVLTAARLTGVEHVVHLSTVAVYGGVEGPVDEDAPIDTPIPPSDLYARSKREAEAVARGIEERHGLPVTIVRPSAVYGERDRLMTPAVADILRFPVVALLGPATNTLPVVYAGNVAAAVRDLLETAGPGRTYDVALDHPLTQRGLFEGLAAGLERDPRYISIPIGLVRAGGAVLSRLGVSAPGAKHLPLRRVIDLALGENPLPSARIRRDVGWAPPHAHGEALERTGRWYAGQSARTGA